MRRIALATTVAVALLAPAGAGAATPSVSVRTLQAPAPSWYTPQLRAQVRSAGPAGVPLPSGAKLPASSLAFLGIRPGQLLIVDGGTLCSSNFVFTSGGSTPAAKATKAAANGKGGGGGKKGGGGGSGSTYYIGTAGHCGDVGDEVVMAYLPKGLVRIGTIVKSTGDPGDRLAPDFALIAIDPALDADVSPSMAYWGGPTGAFTGDGIQPIQHAGWGVVVGTGGTPRAGLAYQWGAEYRFEGAVAPGDSGSGAIVAGGLAAGNITHIAVNTREDVPVWNGGTSITTILALVGGLSLATCAVPVPWPLPGCPPA